MITLLGKEEKSKKKIKNQFRDLWNKTNYDERSFRDEFFFLGSTFELIYLASSYNKETNSTDGIKLFEVRNMLINNLLDILVLWETKVDDSYPDSQFYAKKLKPNRQDRTDFKGAFIICARSNL